MTRLRVTVKDLDKVAELAAWKSEGALGLIKKDNGIQAVYGPKADVLKSDILTSYDARIVRVHCTKQSLGIISGGILVHNRQ